MLHKLRSRWTILAAAIVIVVVALWLISPTDAPAADSVITKVKKGEFKVLVTTAGELRARKFVQITGPANAQQAEAYQMKISSLVPEGTVVKEGDLVAELDRSSIAAKMAEVSLALQKAEAQLMQAQLDSTLNLSKAREEQRTLEYALEEKKLAKEQAKAKMREVGADVERSRNKLNVVRTVMEGFTIRAPAPGMVIYVKEWNGKKKSAGSQINPWDPTVATLPDLTQMESVTYVNEIDVRKIAVGQSVKLTLDADPSKQLSGKVVAVANVGEQRPNADAKVFEVKITVQQADTTLRPGMTTANAVETFTVPNALYVPLEAVTLDGDAQFVYKREGSRVIKQQVETGAMNDNEIVITRGLDDDDSVLLSVPADKDQLDARMLPGYKPGTADNAASAASDTPAGAKKVPVKP